jgi:hypothetical protein
MKINKTVMNVGRSEKNEGFVLHETLNTELHMLTEWPAVADIPYICVQ